MTSLLINANALHIPLADKSVNCVVTSPPYYGTTAILWYNECMNNNNGRFKKGEHRSPSTEFKKGEHWRQHKPYWDKEWLGSEYTEKQRSANEIANQFGITESAILFWLRKHNIQTRSMADIRAIKYWGLSGEKNGMYGKTGIKNANWKGGVTPQRQDFYTSQEWKSACAEVYKRDNATCQKCGAKEKLHVHHVIGFANKEIRADANNLVLLCVKCHRFVHSKKNINGEFIGKEVQE